VTGRQVAELAAAAAHRKNLTDDLLLGSSSMRSGPGRKMSSRQRSSGGLHRVYSGDGLRAMSRSLGGPGGGSASGGPSSRIVNRSRSLHTSGPNPMLSRSVARSGGGLRRSDGPLRRSDGIGQDEGVPPEKRRLGRSRSSLAPSYRGTPGYAGPDNNDDGAPNMRRLGRSRSSLTTSYRAPPEARGVGRSDSRAEPSRRGVGRTCSQNSLVHMSQNGNQMRTDEQSVGEFSNFTIATKDSVNLRKQQIVADPVFDEGTYRTVGSAAEHESVSMATTDVGNYTEYIPENDPHHIPYDGVSVAETVGSYDDEPHGRLLENTRLVVATEHSHPNDIACDAVSLSTINTNSVAYGVDGEESSYVEDQESTLREEIEAFDELDESDEDESDSEETIDEEEIKGITNSDE